MYLFKKKQNLSSEFAATAGLFLSLCSHPSQGLGSAPHFHPAFALTDSDGTEGDVRAAFYEAYSESNCEYVSQSESGALFVTIRGPFLFPRGTTSYFIYIKII